MPVPVAIKEDAPEHINALMVRCRELMIDLEEEGEEIRDKLAKLKQRTRNNQKRLLELHRINSKQTLPTSSTTCCASSDLTNSLTLSTPPSSDTNEKYRSNDDHRRSSTLPLPTQTSVPPVRPPRHHDKIRNRLEELYSTISRQQQLHSQKHNNQELPSSHSRSRTMTSAAVNAVKSRGALIVLEGVDRVGKTTLGQKLVDHLKKIRCPVTYFRFPERNTPVGQLIDEYLKSSSKRVDEHVLHLLFSANRWELSNTIRNTLSQGTSVIVDRYAYSGIAYSSAKKNLPLKWCCEMERGLPRPDLVIYLEVKRDTQHQRPGFGEERFETTEMQDAVRLQYERVMDLSQETWLKIDVDNKSPDQVLCETILPVKRCLDSAATKDIGKLDFFETVSSP